jgi:hypothetical protein
VSSVINLQSGFPIGMTQSDNTLFSGATRPRLTGASFETSGSRADPHRVSGSPDGNLDQRRGGGGGGGRDLRRCPAS